jgi:hypothetical protein
MDKNITLNLTPAEAKVLQTILWNIGGDPSGTRGIANSIGEKLENQCEKFDDVKVNLSMMIKRDSIWFGE